MKKQKHPRGQCTRSRHLWWVAKKTPQHTDRGRKETGQSRTQPGEVQGSGQGSGNGSAVLPTAGAERGLSPRLRRGRATRASEQLRVGHNTRHLQLRLGGPAEAVVMQATCRSGL